jgi:hypothetical protein
MLSLILLSGLLLQPVYGLPLDVNSAGKLHIVVIILLVLRTVDKIPSNLLLPP